MKKQTYKVTAGTGIILIWFSYGILYYTIPDLSDHAGGDKCFLTAVVCRGAELDKHENQFVRRVELEYSFHAEKRWLIAPEFL